MSDICLQISDITETGILSKKCIHISDSRWRQRMESDYIVGEMRRDSGPNQSGYITQPSAPSCGNRP